MRVYVPGAWVEHKPTLPLDDAEELADFAWCCWQTVQQRDLEILRLHDRLKALEERNPR